MGLLRVILALLVVGSHLRAFGGATFAVKSFFIVSGFYMALVISTRYHALPVSSFYISRLLRLLPLYWVVGILTVGAEMLLAPPGEFLHDIASPIAYARGLDPSLLPLSVLFYVGIAVGTMFGLDTGLWLGFSRATGQLSIAPDFSPEATSVVALSPVPQGWTVGLELLFYLIAPFVVRRSVRMILTLCACSLAFRVILTLIGFHGEPWNRALFPSELIYFLLGVLAYRLYVRLPVLKFSRRAEVGFAAMVLIIAVTYWPVYYVVRGNLLWDSLPYLLVAAGIPFLFKLTKDNMLDANLGELSYPIYMCHALVLGFVRWSPLNDTPAIGTGWPRHLITILLVIVMAYLLDRLVVLPIDRLRIRFGAQRRIEPHFAPNEAPIA